MALLMGRQSKNGIISQYLLTDKISEMKTAESTTGSYHFCLYLYHEDGTKTSNFNATVLSQLTHNLKKTYEPEEILDYIYARLYSPKYRKKYQQFLRSDFPRIPAPDNDGEFKRFENIGRQLRELHLMKSPLIDDYATTFPRAGNDEISKTRYEDQKVWINGEQYFGNVPEEAWNFYIGGYQPAQKWLKDRKGRKLNSEDIEHYQKIIKILIETNKIMAQIDTVANLA
ncbi:MAG: type ISP restriction/modification enzyme [Thermoleophilia bacterium]